MAMRVLSGVLVTRGVRSGTATIEFIPHSSTGNGQIAKMIEQGPARPFTSKPCRIVALREIKAADEYRKSDFHTLEHAFRIDSEGTSTKLEINWAVTGDTAIEEISYLVIGEVPDN